MLPDEERWRMSDSPIGDPPPHPVAAVHPRGRHISWIWAIPVVTALIGLWIAWDTLTRRGPLITVTFETAEGLVAGQTHVRHKDVDMGLVQTVALSKTCKRYT
jgi:paraquat-inducible protein B